MTDLALWWFGPGLIAGVVTGLVAARRERTWPTLIGVAVLLAAVTFGAVTARGCDAQPGTAERCEAPDWFYAVAAVATNLLSLLLGTAATSIVRPRAPDG